MSEISKLDLMTCYITYDMFGLHGLGMALNRELGAVKDFVLLFRIIIASL